MRRTRVAVMMIYVPTFAQVFVDPRERWGILALQVWIYSIENSERSQKWAGEPANTSLIGHGEIFELLR